MVKQTSEDLNCFPPFSPCLSSPNCLPAMMSPSLDRQIFPPLSPNLKFYFAKLTSRGWLAFSHRLPYRTRSGAWNKAMRRFPTQKLKPKRQRIRSSFSSESSALESLSLQFSTSPAARGERSSSPLGTLYLSAHLQSNHLQHHSSPSELAFALLCRCRCVGFRYRITRLGRVAVLLLLVRLPIEIFYTGLINDQHQLLHHSHFNSDTMHAFMS